MVRASVIMSIYKEPIDWIKESICSILNQTHRDLEFIIILDEPLNVEAFNYIKNISDKRIKLHVNPINIGLTKSLNIGLKLSTGEYIVRMDADDISNLTRLEKQINFMDNHPEIVASGTSIKKFGLKNEIIHYEDDPTVISCNFTRPNPYLSPIAHPTAIIRKNILDREKILYNENYRTGQDYGLWGDLLSIGKLSNLKEVLLDYRTSSSQITSTKRNNQLKVVLEVIEKFILNWLKNNNLKLDFVLSPSSLKDLRDNKLSSQHKTRLDAFIFGLLLYGDYNWKFTLKYLLSDLSFGIPLKSKFRLIYKKLRYII